MKQLDEKTKMLIAVIAVATVVLFFGIFPAVQDLVRQARTGDTVVIPPPPGTFDNFVPPPPPAPLPPSDAMELVVRHVFANGKHTVSGTITTPTPCHALGYEVFVAESYPEQVHIEFTVSEPSGDMMCAQVLDDKEFSVSFSASEEATIRASQNGMPLTLSFEE